MLGVATMFGRAPAKALNVSNNTANKVSMRGGSKCYHVEITVGEREPEDSALKRFRRLCQSAKIIHEVRRRKTFENPQDIKKRKMKERGLFKFLQDPPYWEEVNGTMESAPFADLFGSPEDIFAAENNMPTATDSPFGNNNFRPAYGARQYDSPRSAPFGGNRMASTAEAFE